MIIHIVYFALVIALAISHIYTAIRNNRKLGKIKLRVITTTRNFIMISWLFIGLIWLLIGIDDILKYLRLRELNDLEDSIYVFCWITLCMLNMIYQFRFGAIRQKGISTVFHKYKWEHIKCYDINQNEIKIFASNKNSFMKKDKEIKWTVKENQVDEIENILNEYVKECYR